MLLACVQLHQLVSRIIITLRGNPTINIMMLRVFSHTKALRNVQKSASVASRFFSTLPEHIVVPMPALSPVSFDDVLFMSKHVCFV